MEEMFNFKRLPIFLQLMTLNYVYYRCFGDSDPRVIYFDDIMAKADKFSETGVYNYSQLLFDVARDQIIVGARDTLFRLTMKNLHKIQKANWSSSADKIQSCIDKGQSEDDCRNYVKVLLKSGKRLFTCGTNAFSPQCTWRELEDIENVTNSSPGIGKCPYNPRANVTALMTHNGQFFSGTEMDFSGTDAAIVRDFGGSILRTNQYNSKWLDEPQFVGSFETDFYVYFLFRENAVEYINCGKRIYSRIARVCKSDNGGQLMLRDNWSTFVKARLNCSLPGEYPFYFDEMQGVTYLLDEGLVYATFTTSRNSIPGSAICVFNLTAINQAFNGPFKHQASMSHGWEPYRSDNHNPGQCAGPSDRQYSIDFTKYQLMDKAVQPATLSPLYNSQLERIVHIAVDVLSTKLHRAMHVIYVSTEDNVIKKISVLPRTQRTCVLEVWKLPTSDIPAVLSLHYLKQTDSLYVGTNTELIRIPGEHCERHKTRQACMNAMDPYCGWNEIKEQCSTPPASDPLVSYWQQNITSCPTFTHPVNGGWSSWSTWTQCTYANSHSDSVDYCLCSIRKCDNPSPQNGGKNCDDIGVQVTNCTVHGGWTNWSAWSSCSESCGIAVKTRKRTCTNPAPAYGGRVCVGADTQEMYCHENPPCPDIVPPSRNGGWSTWDSWSECSTKCGGGYRFRSRRCDNPSPQKPGGLDCFGCTTEYEACNTFPCPESKKLSNFTPWTPLGNGTEKRFRFSCKAPVQDTAFIKVTMFKEEERFCQANGLCSRWNTEDGWSDWSPWSPCSVECGVGVQYRTRTCESRVEECQGLSKMSKPCNTHSCNGEWGCWTDWSNCSASCGFGIRQRSRTCLSINNRTLLANDCQGPSIMQESCQMVPCEDSEGWTSWSSWSNCDESVNQRHRNRTCVDTVLCRGSNYESRMCDDLSIDVSPVIIESASGNQTIHLFVFCAIAFIVGLLVATIGFYYWMKKHQLRVPSSPHYISKQNPYVTVPLKDVHPKRTPSFSSKSSTLVNGTPKLFSKPPVEYETATIKRNSHSLLNGHTRGSNLEEDKFF